jgi:fatty-acyl-CoA synthase
MSMMPISFASAPAADQIDFMDFVSYHARANGERVACVDLAANRDVTYRELDAEIAKCAAWLLTMARAGARVAMLSRNSVEMLVVHFACVRAGMIFQPLNWRLMPVEILALVRDAGPEILIYQSEFAQAAASAREGTSVAHVLCFAPGGRSLTQVIANTPPLAAPANDPDATVTLLYTSGTTGKPKGVIVTGRNAWTTALNFAQANEVAPRDVLLCDMPLFHVAGLFGVARATLLMGGTVLISDRFVPATALRMLSDMKLGITHYFAVPQMAATLLQDPHYAQSDLTRLKALVIGGAPLPRSIVERLLADGVPPIEGYGLSEAGTVFGMPLDRATVAAKAGSCGVPAMMIAVRLVDTDGRDVAPGEVGEIWLKGPSVTPGYWKQPEITAKSFHDGWFKTGDAARRNEDGFYQIVDRWKDMFITGGENVYPAEIESVLAEHPVIVEVAVVGVADPQWGESGCAYVVARAPLTAEDVIAHCRGRLARYKVPKHVRFADALPRTGSGKVKKDELRRAFSEKPKEH